MTRFRYHVQAWRAILGRLRWSRMDWWDRGAWLLIASLWAIIIASFAGWRYPQWALVPYLLVLAGAYFGWSRHVRREMERVDRQLLEQSRRDLGLLPEREERR